MGFSNDSLIILGGKHWALPNLAQGGTVEVKAVLKNYDWILDAEEINERTVVLVTSHNEAQVWDKEKNQLIKAVSPAERCILYPFMLASTGLEFNFCLINSLTPSQIQRKNSHSKRKNLRASRYGV